MLKRDEAVEARGESSDSTDSTDSTGVGRRRLMPFEELYQVCVCVCLCVCVCARNGVYAHTHTHTQTHKHTTYTHTQTVGFPEAYAWERSLHSVDTPLSL
jgi:hypothetical protein